MIGVALLFFWRTLFRGKGFNDGGTLLQKVARELAAGLVPGSGNCVRNVARRRRDWIACLAVSINAA